MTELQAEQIRKMRTQGIGYRAIASVVGLSGIIAGRMVWICFCAYKKHSGTDDVRKGVFVLWSRTDTTIYRQTKEVLLR